MVLVIGDMWHEDRIDLLVKTAGYDDNFNPVISDGDWIDLGACKIHGNQSAKTVPSVDGKDDVYTYQVVITSVLPVIPKLGDRVRITKADGTVSNIEMRVKGFGTVKRKSCIFL